MYIKLCGMRRPQDIEAVNLVKPDYIGFVFYPPSKRFLEAAEAAKLKEGLDSSIKAVGVFVDVAPERVAEYANSNITDLIQLHGSEDEAYIKRLRELTDKPLIQAIRVKDESDIERAEASSAEYILLDSGMGSGVTLDWQLAARLKRSYFLAGGLNCENISAAIEALHPYAVDVSSGIETDGYKDPEKIKRFVMEARKQYE